MEFTGAKTSYRELVARQTLANSRAGENGYASLVMGVSEPLASTCHS